jgi:formate/nitrite transporter FocA (FNT family)
MHLTTSGDGDGVGTAGPRSSEDAVTAPSLDVHLLPVTVGNLVGRAVLFGLGHGFVCLCET